MKNIIEKLEKEFDFENYDQEILDLAKKTVENYKTDFKDLTNYYCHCNGSHRYINAEFASALFYFYCQKYTVKTIRRLIHWDWLRHSCHDRRLMFNNIYDSLNNDELKHIGC